MQNDSSRLTTIDRSSLNRYAQRVVFGLLIAVTVTVASACQKPLFTDNAPRTQFDTYDKLRQQNQSLLVPDEFGNPQPALRARLSPQS